MFSFASECLFLIYWIILNTVIFDNVAICSVFPFKISLNDWTERSQNIKIIKKSKNKIMKKKKKKNMN